MVEVSVIIPTYNRSHLIGETLDSIISQSFSDWECIVVDDGSTDYTLELLEFYTIHDNRIKYFRRPDHLRKGANTCRNFGFENSNGCFIIWFDSDDIMVYNHIETKVNVVISSQCDFAISKSINFNDKGEIEIINYNLHSKAIRASDFILSKIHWLTYDIILNRSIADKIDYNEEMDSWQDYNYFCKMLLITEKGEFIDDVLTHRRIHGASIQGGLHSKVLLNELLKNKLITFNEISEKINPYVKKELIYDMMNICFNLAKSKRIPRKFKKVLSIVEENFGFKSVPFFILSMLTARLLGKGEKILEKSKYRNSIV